MTTGATGGASAEHHSRRNSTGYLPIENYGLIGNMRTCALVGIDGSIDFMCWYIGYSEPPESQIYVLIVPRPDFDSPSIFCRLLDKDKGGYFSIAPPTDVAYTTKQQYLPSSNILQTSYIHDEGVATLVDFFPRPKNSFVVTKGSKQMAYREATAVQDELKKWLVRRVECIRGVVDIGTSF